MFRGHNVELAGKQNRFVDSLTGNSTQGGLFDKGKQNRFVDSLTGISTQGGLFDKGVWLCDCRPRVPAEHSVKKEGKNRGKWFFTCQKTESERCGFFLWEEEAATRMNNSRTEPRQRARSPTSRAQHDKRRAVTPNRAPPPISPPQTPMSRGKRRLPWVNQTQDSASSTDPGYDEEEDSFAWSLTGEEVELLSKTVDQAVANTPRKMVKFDAIDTPQQQTRVKNGLATPGTTPHKARTDNDTSERSGVDTPTPVRFRDAMAPSASGPSGDATSDLTADMLALLGSQRIELNAEKEKELRALLDKHTKRYHGVVRGRDKTREAVKDRDGRIVRLQQQLTSMEADKESQRFLNKQLRQLLEVQKGRRRSDLEREGTAYC